MARTKEFDRETVLRKAVAAFRERGYEGTSIQVLVDRMGIHRASLYDTYGSKEQLFREALGCYRDLVREAFRPVLESTGRALDVLRRFFDQAIAAMVESTPVEGSCLALTAAMSGANQLEGIHEEVREHYAWFERHFVRLLEQARLEGDVRSSHPTDVLAAHLLQTLQGVVAASAVTPDEAQIRASVGLAFEVL